MHRSNGETVNRGNGDKATGRRGNKGAEGKKAVGGSQKTVKGSEGQGGRGWEARLLEDASQGPANSYQDVLGLKDDRGDLPGTEVPSVEGGQEVGSSRYGGSKHRKVFRVRLASQIASQPHRCARADSHGCLHDEPKRRQGFGKLCDQVALCLFDHVRRCEAFEKGQF